MEQDRPREAGADVWVEDLRQGPEVIVFVPNVDIKPDMLQVSHAIKEAVPKAEQH